MHLDLPLSSMLEAKLRQEAEAAGIDLGTYLARVLDERAAKLEPERPTPAGQTFDERLEFFRRIAARHPAPIRSVDASRESIYFGHEA